MNELDTIGFEVRLDQEFDMALESVVSALKSQGFGVLTRIDVHTTLREKLGEDFRKYTILGACNPPLAHKALSTDPVVGLMLPCNITVEALDDGCLVRIANPEVMLQIGSLKENRVLIEVASQARARLEYVAELLTKPETA
jgi:uncharacterized protein (DUF302 family)